MVRKQIMNNDNVKYVDKLYAQYYSYECIVNRIHPELEVTTMIAYYSNWLKEQGRDSVLRKRYKRGMDAEEAFKEEEWNNIIYSDRSMSYENKR